MESSRNASALQNAWTFTRVSGMRTSVERQPL